MRFLIALLFGLACALGSASPSHAQQKTRAQLNTEIATQYPDNAMGLITPQVLRGVSTDTVNSAGILGSINSFSSDNHFGSGVPWVDVKSGANGCAAAVGNNSTDDTTAIQCQLDWLNTNHGGGTVYLPFGNYKVSSSLIVKGAVFLTGAGRQLTDITAAGDNTVITFDAATCVRGIGMSNLFVVGYLNVAATQDNVIVGTNCPATISHSDIWGGHHAINNAGSDGLYFDLFPCGWTGDNIYTTGGNWYINIKADTCGPSTGNGFEVGNVSATTENYLYRVDLSCGTCTNSIKINDGGGSHAYTYFYGVVASSAVAILGAAQTSFIGGEFGSTSFVGAGSVSIVGARGLFSPITPSGGAYNCAANFNINCSLTTPIQLSATSTATSTITCGSGSLTGGSTATWHYWNFGKFVNFTVSGTPTYTSCTSSLVIALPNSWTSQNYVTAVYGSNGNTGGMLSGYLGASVTGMTIFKYDGTFPVPTGTPFQITGSFEIQ